MEDKNTKHFEKVLIFAGDEIIDICNIFKYKEKYQQQNDDNNKLFRERNIRKLLLNNKGKTTNKSSFDRRHLKCRLFKKKKSFSMKLENFETTIFEDKNRQEYIIVFHGTANYFNTNVAHFKFTINRNKSVPIWQSYYSLKTKSKRSLKRHPIGNNNNNKNSKKLMINVKLKRKKPKNFEIIGSFEEYIRKRIQGHLKAYLQGCQNKISVSAVYITNNEECPKVFLTRDIKQNRDIRRFMRLAGRIDPALKLSKFETLKNEIKLKNIPFDCIQSFIVVNQLKTQIFIECNNKKIQELFNNKNSEVTTKKKLVRFEKKQFINVNSLNLKLENLMFRGSNHKGVMRFVNVIEELVVKNLKDEDIEKKLEEHLNSCKVFISSLDKFETKHLQKRASNILCNSLPKLCLKPQSSTFIGKADKRARREELKVSQILAKIEDLQIKIKTLVKSSPSLHSDAQIQSYLNKIENAQTRRKNASSKTTLSSPIQNLPSLTLMPSKKPAELEITFSKLNENLAKSVNNDSLDVSLTASLNPSSINTNFEEGRECSSKSSRFSNNINSELELAPTTSYDLNEKFVGPTKDNMKTIELFKVSDAKISKTPKRFSSYEPNLKNLENFVIQIRKINKSYYARTETPSRIRLLKPSPKPSSKLPKPSEVSSTNLNLNPNNNPNSSNLTPKQCLSEISTQTDETSETYDLIPTIKTAISAQISENFAKYLRNPSSNTASQTDISIHKNASIKFSGQSMQLSKNLNITNVRKQQINIRNISEDTNASCQRFFLKPDEPTRLKEEIQSMCEECNKAIKKIANSEKNDAEQNNTIEYKLREEIKSRPQSSDSSKSRSGFTISRNRIRYQERPKSKSSAVASPIKKEEILSQIKATLETVTERFKKNTLLISQAANMKEMHIVENMNKIVSTSAKKNNPEFTVKRVNWQIVPQASSSLVKTVVKTKEEITTNLSVSLKLLKNLNDVTRTIRKNPKEASQKLKCIRDELMAQRKVILNKKLLETNSSRLNLFNETPNYETKQLVSAGPQKIPINYQSAASLFGPDVPINQYGYPETANKGTSANLNNILTPKTRSICNTDLSIIKHRDRNDGGKPKGPSIKSKHIQIHASRKSRQMYIAKAYKKEFAGSITTRDCPIVQTTIENPLVPKIVRPIRRKTSLPDSPQLSNLSLTDVQPFNSEYPRKDNMSPAVESYLNKLLLTPAASILKLEPSLKCADNECATCEAEKNMFEGFQILNARSRKNDDGHFKVDMTRAHFTRHGRNFDFKQFMIGPNSNLMNSNAQFGGNVNFTVCPVNVNYGKDVVNSRMDMRVPKTIPPANLNRIKSLTKKNTSITNNSNNAQKKTVVPVGKKLNEEKHNQNKIQRSIQQAIMKNQEKFQAMQKILTFTKPPEKKSHKIMITSSNSNKASSSKSGNPKITTSHPKKVEKPSSSFPSASQQDYHYYNRFNTKKPNQQQQQLLKPINCKVFDKKYSEQVSLSSMKSLNNTRFKSQAGGGGFLTNNNSKKSQEDIQNYISLVEQKFLKTFSLKDTEKEGAYKSLVEEIKQMLTVLNNNDQPIKPPQQQQQQQQQIKRCSIDKIGGSTSQQPTRKLKQFTPRPSATKKIPIKKVIEKKKSITSKKQSDNRLTVKTISGHTQQSIVLNNEKVFETAVRAFQSPKRASRPHSKQSNSDKQSITSTNLLLTPDKLSLNSTNNKIVEEKVVMEEKTSSGTSSNKSSDISTISDQSTSQIEPIEKEEGTPLPAKPVLVRPSTPMPKTRQELIQHQRTATKIIMLKEPSAGNNGDDFTSQNSDMAVAEIIADLDKKKTTENSQPTTTIINNDSNNNNGNDKLCTIHSSNNSSTSIQDEEKLSSQSWTSTTNIQSEPVLTSKPEADHNHKRHLQHHRKEVTISSSTSSLSALHNDDDDDDNDDDYSTFCEDTISECSSSSNNNKNNLIQIKTIELSITIYFKAKLHYSYLNGHATITHIPIIYQLITYHETNLTSKPLTELFLQKYKIKDVFAPESYDTLNLGLIPSNTQFDIENEFIKEYSDKILSESLNNILASNSDFNLHNLIDKTPSSDTLHVKESNPNFLEFLDILTSISRLSIEPIDTATSTQIYYKQVLTTPLHAHKPLTYHQTTISIPIIEIETPLQIATTTAILSRIPEPTPKKLSIFNKQLTKQSNELGNILLTKKFNITSNLPKLISLKNELLLLQKQLNPKNYLTPSFSDTKCMQILPYLQKPNNHNQTVSQTMVMNFNVLKHPFKKQQRKQPKKMSFTTPRKKMVLVVKGTSKPPNHSKSVRLNEIKITQDKIIEIHKILLISLYISLFISIFICMTLNYKCE